MSDYYTRLEEEAVKEVRKLLTKPLAPTTYETGVIDESTNETKYFDPWDIFPFYGSYSSAFDDMALEVLKNIQDGNFRNETLAHEMFREVLCKKSLCDYGTSPRGCWANSGFEELLPELIKKWKEYYSLVWESKEE